ncbi:MAG: outer membrane lipid asymmetry maintenance protein MlaD [Rhodobacteraceae bacterium]|nr:outer membrane lipid asymmetry maintenance protein MlaD [Paracoccaceae bacterium]
MRENWIEVLTGAIVLVVAAAFVVFATSGGTSASRDNYELTASFTSVEGISVGTDVRMAGVKIGSVTSMELNPTTFRADVSMAVAETFELPDDSTVLISSEGLLGGNFVEVQPGGSPFNLEAGDEIVDTQSSVSLITLLLRFVGGDE